MNPFNTAWLVIALPLLGFLFHAFFGKMVGKRIVGTVGSLLVFGSFGIGLHLLSLLLQRPDQDRQIISTMADWITVGKLHIPFELLIDPLSLLMVLIVTGVGGLIHVYSTGYMADDQDYARFFTYLNLFIAMMLTLVLANNLVLMFVGWEGVGLCSYLLIGFWYNHKANALAANKAFIVNRIGDFGFMLAIFIAFTMFGTVSFIGTNGQEGMFAKALSMNAAGALSVAGITTLALLLFFGATGKSAQFPLYFWLPDAMAGPTPVSALIHAATMVTAGVVLVTRCHVFFLLAPTAMMTVAVIGAFTAVFAASIAICQNDIKKVLAYSTVSQIGYMFLACGVGAFATGMFHVTTHAFFKALLFLGAGAVIYSMHHQQDMRVYGGLKTKLKITFATMMCGWLAICGIPPFAGFFSKDEILAKVYGTQVAGFGNVAVILWAVGLITAVMTAFYMTRLMSLTFFGEPRWNDKFAEVPGDDSHDVSHGHGAAEDPKDAPMSMMVPLMILAVLSVVGGFMGGFALFKIPNLFESFLEPSAATPELMEGLAAHLSHNVELALVMASIIGAVLGLVIGLARYKGVPTSERETKGIRGWVARQYGYDNLITNTIGCKLGNGIGHIMWQWVDVTIIDGAVNGIGLVTSWVGEQVRKLQNGRIRDYAMAMMIGAVVLLLWILISGSRVGL
ncbi:MAG: NADH-quinone oxidoreductase subunit L [Armatimonadota bacterium]